MSLLASWLASPPPEAAVEISPGRGVCGGRLAAAARTPWCRVMPSSRCRQARSRLLSHPRTLPTLTLSRARSTRACQSLGLKPKRVALVIPDVAAKVSLVRFDQMPTRRDDLDQLIRWQVQEVDAISSGRCLPQRTPPARTKRRRRIRRRSGAPRRQSANTRASANESALKPVSWTSATFAVINLFLSRESRHCGRLARGPHAPGVHVDCDPAPR